MRSKLLILLIMNVKILVLSILGMVILLANTGCDKKVAEKIKGKVSVLRYANGAHPDYNKFRESEAKKFENLYPDVIVKYEPIEGRYWDKIMTQIGGGTVPDVFRNDDVMTLAKKGAVLDLTPYMEKDKEYFEQIYPQLIEFHRYRGKIYGLPSNLNVNVLFYNKRLFDEVGISYPDKSWLWDTMVEAAKRLIKRDNRGITNKFGVICDPPWALFKLNGGNIWSEGGDRCVINSPQNTEVLLLYKDLFSDKYRVSPNIIEQKDQGNAWQMFLSERVGMVHSGTWLTALLNLKKNLTWGIAPIPKIKNNASFLSFNTLSVSSSTKNPQLAYELAKFLTRPEAIKFLVDVGDSIPIRWSREANEYFLNDPRRPKGENQVYLTAMNYAFSEKWAYNSDIPYELQRIIIGEETEKFLVTKELSAKEALQNIQNRLNFLLKENRLE